MSDNRYIADTGDKIPRVLWEGPIPKNDNNPHDISVRLIETDDMVICEEQEGKDALGQPKWQSCNSLNILGLSLKEWFKEMRDD